MTQWEVFLAIVAIVGFCITIFKVSGFFNSLDSSMKILNNTILGLSEQLKEVARANHESHKRIWKHNEEQDGILNSHETRISLIEKGRAKNED